MKSRVTFALRKVSHFTPQHAFHEVKFQDLNGAMLRKLTGDGSACQLAPSGAVQMRAALSWQLLQDADGTMQCFVWHKDQKLFAIAAILSLADDSHKDASS